ncbi:hypothetical protein ACLB2K_022023 [Fragaria x ananassa]
MAEDRSSKGAQIEFFDDEIISEILARLPVKSVVRFRCVSKWWSALISDPYFTKKHLSYSKEGITENTSRLLYSLYPPQSLDYEALKDLKDHSDCSFANRVLDFPVRKLPRYHFLCSIVGCCDGLVCIIVEEEEDGGYFMLWNPCTRNSRKLPRTIPKLCNPDRMSFKFCGFGYDSATDDYKVIVGDINHIVFEETTVYVFALKTSSWKKLPIINNPLDITGRGFFLNGALHWLTRNPGHCPRTVLLSFDLVEEKFHDKIPLPDCEIQQMSVVKNCLCVFNHAFSWRNVTTIWLMKEYGVKQSWTPVIRCSTENFPGDFRHVSVQPLCILEDGQVLVVTNYGERFLVLYDPKENTFKTVTKTHTQLSAGAFVYTETLVSPVTGSAAVETTSDPSHCFPVIVKAEDGPLEDAYWKKREAEAEKVAEQSVNPHPEKVTEELNKDVGELVYEQQKHKQN